MDFQYIATVNIETFIVNIENHYLVGNLIMDVTNILIRF